MTQNSEVKDDRIVFFRLTDESHVLNAATRLKIKYPHYVGLEYINIKDDVDGSEAGLSKEEGFEELSTSEQFDKFFHFITEKDLDQTQKDAVQSVVDELEKEAE